MLCFNHKAFLRSNFMAIYALFAFSLCAYIPYGYAHEYKEKQQTTLFCLKIHFICFFGIGNHYLLHH